MTELAQALSNSLLRFIWEGAIAGILCALALAMLRGRSSNLRYAAACCGLALMAAMPAVDTIAALGRPIAGAGIAAAGAAVTPVIRAASATATGSSAPSTAEAWTLRLWAVGVFLFAFRLAMSYRHASWLRRSGEAAAADLFERASELAVRMGIRRRVSVLISRVADCPSVTGWLRPAILLPAAVFASLDVEQLEAILAHELAHIRRHDYLVNLLQTVVETLLFYHPAVWWLSARIRRERECCCDDIAIRYTGGVLPYARALASLERLRTAPALMPAFNGSPLLFRIRRLTGETDTAPSRLPAITAGLVAVVCLALNVHWARGQSRDTANVVSRAPLAYPASARAKGIEGTVIAEVTLDGNGNVTDARIVSGPYELRKAALSSVLDWRFGHASQREVRQVPIDFRKDMATAESVPGVLTLSDPLNERLMHLAEERTRLEGTLQELREQQTRAQRETAGSQQQRDRVAELRAQMQAVEAQLEEEQRRLAQVSADLPRGGVQSDSHAESVKAEMDNSAGNSPSRSSRLKSKTFRRTWPASTPRNRTKPPPSRKNFRRRSKPWLP